MKKGLCSIQQKPIRDIVTQPIPVTSNKPKPIPIIKAKNSSPHIHKLTNREVDLSRPYFCAKLFQTLIIFKKRRTAEAFSQKCKSRNIYQKLPQPCQNSIKDCNSHKICQDLPYNCNLTTPLAQFKLALDKPTSHNCTPFTIPSNQFNIFLKQNIKISSCRYAINRCANRKSCLNIEQECAYYQAKFFNSPLNQLELLLQKKTRENCSAFKQGAYEKWMVNYLSPNCQMAIIECWESTIFDNLEHNCYQDHIFFLRKPLQQFSKILENPVSKECKIFDIKDEDDVFYTWGIHNLNDNNCIQNIIQCAVGSNCQSIIEICAASAAKFFHPPLLQFEI